MLKVSALLVAGLLAGCSGLSASAPSAAPAGPLEAAIPVSHVGPPPLLGVEDLPEGFSEDLVPSPGALPPVSATRLLACLESLDNPDLRAAPAEVGYTLGDGSVSVYASRSEYFTLVAASEPLRQFSGGLDECLDNLFVPALEAELSPGGHLLERAGLAPHTVSFPLPDGARADSRRLEVSLSGPDGPLVVFLDLVVVVRGEESLLFTAASSEVPLPDGELSRLVGLVADRLEGLAGDPV